MVLAEAAERLGVDVETASWAKTVTLTVTELFLGCLAVILTRTEGKPTTLLV